MDRDFHRERHLIQEWSYFKPMGPHIGDDPEDTVKNLEEMSDADVDRLIEIGEEMSEYIAEIHGVRN